MSILEGDLAKLLDLLAHLPPVANRYSITATALHAKFAYRLDPRPKPLTFIFCGLLGIVLILAIVGMAFRIRTGTFRLLTVQSGLIMPQATLLFALWMSVFCVGEIGSLVGLQTWFDRRKPLPPFLVFMMGTVWISAYWSFGPWLWSIAAANIRTHIHIERSRASNLLPGVMAKAGAKLPYRGSVILLNTCAIATHVLGFPPLIVVFGYAAKSWSQALSILEKVLSSLHAAAPTYDPSTFSASADLIPLLAPLTEAQAHVDQMFQFYSIGFGIWVEYNALFSLTWLTPFFYCHMKQLIGLSKRGTSFAMSVSHSTGPGSPPGHLAANTPEASTTPIAAAIRTTDYMVTMMASALVYLAAAVITAIALAVALNPDFVIDQVKGAIFIYLAAGMFALLTPFVMAVFARRSYVAYREFQRISCPTTERLNHPPIGRHHIFVTRSHQIYFDPSEKNEEVGGSAILHFALDSREPTKASGVNEEKSILDCKLELGRLVVRKQAATPLTIDPEG